MKPENKGMLSFEQKRTLAQCQALITTISDDFNRPILKRGGNTLELWILRNKIRLSFEPYFNPPVLGFPFIS